VAVAQHHALFPCAGALVRYTALAMFNLVLLCPQLSAYYLKVADYKGLLDYSQCAEREQERFRSLTLKDVKRGKSIDIGEKRGPDMKIWRIRQ
jgi:hypothetical protein